MTKEVKKLVESLSADFIFYSSMIHALRTEEAEIVAMEEGGILIRHKKGYYHMITAKDVETGKRLMQGIKQCDLLLVHEPFLIEEFRKKYSLYDEEICYQAVYIPEYLKEMGQLSKEQWNEKLKEFYLSDSLEQRKLEVKRIKERYGFHRGSKEQDGALLIQPLDLSYEQTILSHYTMLPEEIIRERLQHHMIYGGFKEEELIGFIGLHQEGSIGILEIFPEHQRKGYATQMELFMIKKQLLAGAIPYGQIDQYNKSSMELQRKLGMQLSDRTICWLFQ